MNITEFAIYITIQELANTPNLINHFEKKTTSTSSYK